MPRLDIDIDALAAELEALPEGLYAARIEAFSDLKEDKNGNRYMSVAYVVTEPGHENRKVTDNYVAIDGNNSWRLRSLIKSTAHANNKVGDTMELVGQECKLRVTNELYEGRVSARVDGYIPHPTKQ